MQNKFTWFGTTVLMTLAACFLLRTGQTHLEGLRGEPSQPASTRSAENHEHKIIFALHPAIQPQIALPKNELGAMGEKTLAELPSNSDFKKLTSEEVHTMPAIMMNAAMKLRTFEDNLDQKIKSAQSPDALRSIASEGAAFYQNCSNKEETPSAIRATCYLQFIQYSVKSGHPENIFQNQMPPDVLQIAAAISPSQT